MASASGTLDTVKIFADGNRILKTEGGQTTLYVNRYFEVNLLVPGGAGGSTSANTSYYYLAGSLIAMSENTTLKYMHQDELGGTSVMSSSSGALLGTIKYAPFGATRSITGIIATDKKFTGQILDDTGLYYYNARYYDPTIGRFISPDTVIPNSSNPQCFNRYTYCLNNPLRYTDPSGNTVTNNGYVMNGVNFDNIEEYAFAPGYRYDPEILVSYATLKSKAEDLCNYMENANYVVDIGWKNLDYTAYGEKMSPNGNFVAGEHNGTININTKYQGGSSAKIACIMGHEAFHADIQIGLHLGNDPGNFAANEEFAFAIEYYLEEKLGVAHTNGFCTYFKDYSPDMSNIDKKIQTGAKHLMEYSYLAYSRPNPNYHWYTCLWEAQVIPLDKWHPSDPNGTKTLTVAKSVWVK